MESCSRTAGGHFVEALERFTAQLRDEYERDIHGLEQQIRQLSAQLSRAQAGGGGATDERGSKSSSRKTQHMSRHESDATWPPSVSARKESGESIATWPPSTNARKESGESIATWTPSANTWKGSGQCSASEVRPEVNHTWSHATTGASTVRGRSGFSRRMLGSGEYETELPPGSSNPALALIARLVQSWWFELFFSILIVLNAVVLGFEAQYFGMEVGTLVGYHQRDAATEWPWASTLFEAFSWFFGIAFTIEVLLRILGLRARFAHDVFNWMDLAIVLVWIVGKFGRVLPINTQLIRMTRLGKLVRLMRLVKNIQGLDSLFLVTTSLKGSLSVLTWTSVLLFVVLLLNALLLNQLLTEFYLTDAAFPESDRKEVYRYFGSFTTSLFSMFELTLANWPPISRVLYEKVSEWFILFAILHKITIGFAIIGVINGVFMQETFKVAQQDDELMVRQAKRAKRLHEARMTRLMQTADRSGKGALDIDEFRQIFQSPALSAWMASVGLVAQDVDQLFKMMDDGDGSLSSEEVVKGVAKLKGPARNIDLHTLIYENRRLQNTVEKHLELVRSGRGPDQATCII